MTIDSFSDSIMNLRYSREINGKKETWEDISHRVPENVFTATPNVSKAVISAVQWAIQERKFIPGGRFLAQAGREYHQVNNCFCLRAVDDREGWGDLSSKATVMLMSGGGIGVDYCLGKGTKILKTDLTWENVENIREGDSLIGFDEALNLQKGIIQEARVEKISVINRPSFRVITDSGEIVCSAEHRFVARKIAIKPRTKEEIYHWVEAKDLTGSYEIAFTTGPWEVDSSFEAGWLSGIFDGEGWVSSSGGKSNMGVSQKEGLVLNKIKHILFKNNINFSEYKNGSDVTCISPCGKWERLKVLGKYRPIRLLQKADVIWKGAKIGGKTTKPARIISITSLGDTEVYATRTTTGTLISNGFLSHNSALRPSGSPLKRSGGTSSGVLPAMKITNEIGRGVMSGGKRRSAIWAGLIWSHPDIVEFIDAKNWSHEVRKIKEKDYDFPATLDMTNISVILDRAFFDAYDDGDGKAHEIYWKVIERMCKTGEPGFSVNYDNPRESLRNA